MDAHSAGRTARSLEPLHALGYFSPMVEAEIVALGVRRGRAAYFASRAAALGVVGPGLVTATFYNFHPGLVAHCVPACWATTTPQEVVAARLRGIDAAYRHLLGEAVDSPEVAEAADLVRTAAAGCTPYGRGLYAAHADLEWPEPPHLALWHGLTLLREHRGDGHLAALMGAGLGGLEALITHTATGNGFVPEAARATRGWSEQEWAAGEADLAERGLLDDTGALSTEGAALRERIETQTDELGAAPWLALGDAGADRLREIVRPLVKTALLAGAFPAGVFASR